MEELKVNVTAESGSSEIIMRTGDALKVYDPIPLRIQGQITAPREFYDTRKIQGGYFNAHNTHITVNRDKGEIVLKHNESDNFFNQITGTLSPSTEYETLGINKDAPKSPQELATLLKRNRFLFADKQEGMKIISDLMAFKGSVKSDVEAVRDDRGNRKNSVQVAVESNVPLSFMLTLPLFKGGEKQRLKVDILLEAKGHIVDCYLESIEAIEAMQERRSEVIDEQLSAFKTDGITVIET